MDSRNCRLFVSCRFSVFFLGFLAIDFIFSCSNLLSGFQWFGQIWTAGGCIYSPFRVMRREGKDLSSLNSKPRSLSLGVAVAAARGPFFSYTFFFFFFTHLVKSNYLNIGIFPLCPILFFSLLLPFLLLCCCLGTWFFSLSYLYTSLRHSLHQRYWWPSRNVFLLTFESIYKWIYTVKWMGTGIQISRFVFWH